MSYLRAVLRLLAIISSTLLFLIPLLIYQIFQPNNLVFALQVRLRWAKFLFRILGLKIIRKGVPSQKSILFISNHRSYFDPIVALHDIKAVPIAKEEIRSWPFIGYAARATGIIFVKRESSKSRKNTLDALAEHIKKGTSILIYPEGTTNGSIKSSKFKKGAFYLAAKQNITIVPVAIDYRDPEDAWVNQDSFISHFFNFIGKSNIEIRISYGPPIQQNDPELLLALTQSWIDKELQQMRAEWPKQI